MKRVFFTFLQH